MPPNQKPSRPQPRQGRTIMDMYVPASPPRPKLSVEPVSKPKKRGLFGGLRKEKKPIAKEPIRSAVRESFERTTVARPQTTPRPIENKQVYGRPIYERPISKHQPTPAPTIKAKRPQPDIQPPSAKFWLVFILIIILLGIIGGGSAYYFLKYKPAHKPKPEVKAAAVDNTNHVTDDRLGLKFAISKDLVSIETTELLKQNPNFIYGFKQNDVPNVQCIISQQKRTSGGAVAATALRDGTLAGIKKSFPDAKLDKFEDVLLDNGHDAASMIISYTDNKVTIKEHMVVAATDPRVTFAFCSSPSPLYDFYNAKFQPFFDSLSVY